MTRKDYILIAKALADARFQLDDQDQVIGVDWAAIYIADTLECDNSHFDRERFLKAAKGETT